MKIKVGIDAKWYFDGPPSGKVVVRNLVDELIKINNNHIELFLIVSSKNIDQAEELFRGKAKLIPVYAKPNLLSNLIIVPFVVKKYNLNFILYQNFANYGKSKWKKIAFVHDVLFLDYPQFYSPVELLYYKPMSLLAKRSDYVITISNSEKTRILKHHIAEDQNTAVVYHGVNDNFMPLDKYNVESIRSIKKRYNLPDKFVLYVGRINIRKNLLNLIRAFIHIDESVKLLIVGEREFKNEDIEKCILDNNLLDRISFSGYVPQADLPLIYALAKVFCFPSYAEGFGMPPLEAMKCGVPVVVSDRTSLPEVCGDGAVYIDPDDPMDIAMKTNTLLQDEKYYNLMAGRALAHANHFTWQKSAENILKFIMEKS